MPGKPSDLVQGTLDMLILKTLALEPMHGYGISVRIEQMSKGVFRLNAGSLFLAIQRLAWTPMWSAWLTGEKRNSSSSLIKPRCVLDVLEM